MKRLFMSSTCHHLLTVSLDGQGYTDGLGKKVSYKVERNCYKFRATFLADGLRLSSRSPYCFTNFLQLPSSKKVNLLKNLQWRVEDLLIRRLSRRSRASTQRRKRRRPFRAPTSKRCWRHSRRLTTLRATTTSSTMLSLQTFMNYNAWKTWQAVLMAIFSISGGGANGRSTDFKPSRLGLNAIEVFVIVFLAWLWAFSL